MNRGLVEHKIVTSEFVEDVVSTSDKKKAPLGMERIQKGYCKCLSSPRTVGWGKTFWRVGQVPTRKRP